MHDLEKKAQEAAEKRLEHCMDELYDESLVDSCECSAPFCGCSTCLVREIIDAAWPYLKELAAVAEQVDAPDSNSGPEMGAGSNPAGGTSEADRLRRAILQHRVDYVQDAGKSESDWRYSSIEEINRKLWASV